MSTKNFARGAEWRQWDLHIHSPASFHWNGEQFDRADPGSEFNTRLIDDMIAAMNAAKPEVFALMDYWTFDGWLFLQRRLAEPNAPKLNKVVFPGIELRLAAPMKGRLNVHAIFSDKISEQRLNDFKAKLTIEIIKRPLSDDALIELARQTQEDKIKHHGLDPTRIKKDNWEALKAGSTIAELSCDSYKKAILETPADMVVGFMPYDTSDGLNEIKWAEHYAYFLGLFQTSPIFETRKQDLWAAFVGKKTEGNLNWFENFHSALHRIPRLAVSGSDAHQCVGTQNGNDKRGYGDFPSRKATWIKADPSFHGLLQAIKEPEKRSFIGESPPKLLEVSENKTFYIDTVEVKKTSTKETGLWLDGCHIPLNSDLVAIIGNKGSGKSALADVIALLGNSRQKEHFTFLNKQRFRGRLNEPAKHFTGVLTWRDGSQQEMNLAEDPAKENIELVRYIPQGHFEKICNDYMSGNSNSFEDELRSVIFSHANDSIRLGASNFDQLINQQEKTIREKLAELRKDLKKLNDEISNIERQLQPSVRQELVELLTLKEKQIYEHNKIRPAILEKPTEQLSKEQSSISSNLDRIAEEIRRINQAIDEGKGQSLALVHKDKAIENVRNRIEMLVRNHSQFISDTEEDVKRLGIQQDDLVKLVLTAKPLDDLSKEIIEKKRAIAEAKANYETRKLELNSEQSNLNDKLNAPQLAYQNSVKIFEEWTAKLDELNGTISSPESLSGLKESLSQIDCLPSELIRCKELRLQLTAGIFCALNDLREARAKLFQPVQEIIQNNDLIKDEYKLQFQAALHTSSEKIADSLFAFVKQQSGEFRGSEESISTIKSTMDRHDIQSKDGLLSFVTELHEKIERSSGAPSTSPVGIAGALRKDKLASDVYDLLFGLQFLEPRYTLLFQDTQIEQLSPGQRGALLLIFYLLVDKGHNPIILDQPEENLDNQTVVSLLVPVLTEAKKRRQIIMVTHNPNLAVVCDAEQVIFASFDRKGDFKITYTSGSIESAEINSHVVNVLEGTKPAFDNRRDKYH